MVVNWRSLVEVSAIDRERDVGGVQFIGSVDMLEWWNLYYKFRVVYHTGSQG